MEEDFNTAITVIENDFIVGLPSEMTNEMISKIEKLITARAYQNDITGAILDFSRVSVLDTYTYLAFEHITQVFSLMGIQSVWVGLGPGVVAGLIDLDITSNSKINMSINLENGLKLLNKIKR
ncbi:STAS domain-containing protein [Acetobacterium woodii]|nr:STAS domain-containing protein [Acetobacterium woodii]